MKLAFFLSVLLLTGCVTSAHADSFTASYLAAGVQSSSASTYVENFNSAAKSGSGTYTTTFNGSGITGTYSGSFNFVNADQYGGANGIGKYITSGSYSGTGTPYSLSLSSNVNYFGLWFSALDAGNQLSFYRDNTLLYSFTPADFIKLVGTCPPSGYCGNPNSGADPYEQFAFLNFYDSNGSFNKIVFTQGSNYVGDFESDNHTIGNLSTAPGGTAITPEPSSFALLGTGVLGVIGAARRRFLNA